MEKTGMTRRDYLYLMGAGATALATSTVNVGCAGTKEHTEQEQPAEPNPAEVADRARRMQWWHAAKFGMVIHWGLYSVLGRHEWAMEEEGIPVAEYEQ